MLYFVSMEAEGGGTDYALVAADSGTDARSIMEDMFGRTVIQVFDDVEDELHGQYDGVAFLATL